METGNARKLVLFALFQLLVFIFYYFNVSLYSTIEVSRFSFYAYVFIAWIEILVFYLLTDIRYDILKNFKNVKGFIVLITVIALWAYAIEISIPGSNNIPYIFTTLFTLVCFQEFNFRLITIEVLDKLTSIGVSAIISSFLYTGFFSIYLFTFLGGYPGNYSFLFILDEFSMGLVISAVYVATRSVYYTSSITLSLYMLGLLPITPAVISYIFVPV